MKKFPVLCLLLLLTGAAQASQTGFPDVTKQAAQAAAPKALMIANTPILLTGGQSSLDEKLTAQ